MILIVVYKSVVYNIAAVPGDDDHTAHLLAVPSIAFPAVNTLPGHHSKPWRRPNSQPQPPHLAEAPLAVPSIAATPSTLPSVVPLYHR